MIVPTLKYELLAVNPTGAWSRPTPPSMMVLECTLPSPKPFNSIPTGQPVMVFRWTTGKAEFTEIPAMLLMKMSLPEMETPSPLIAIAVPSVINVFPEIEPLALAAAKTPVVPPARRSAYPHSERQDARRQAICQRRLSSDSTRLVGEKGLELLAPLRSEEHTSELQSL